MSVVSGDMHEDQDAGTQAAPHPESERANKHGAGMAPLLASRAPWPRSLSLSTSSSSLSTMMAVSIAALLAATAA